MSGRTEWARRFSDFGGTIYLNCAAQGPLPRASAEAVRATLVLKQTPHVLRDEDYFSYPDAYRGAAARLIGAEPRDVAVMDSATDGIMLVVNGLDWKEGDEVLVAAGEFPANRFPWLSLEARGVRVREIEIPPGDAGLEAVEEARMPRTRVLAASWVRYATGLRVDAAALGTLCKDRGILFVLDGSQGIGGLPFDVGKIPCDIVACAGYKWLLGPLGIGFAWVEPELGERLHLANINWYAIEGARDFNRLSHCSLKLVPGARRFDVNETASFFNLAAATASLAFLEEVTVPAVARHVRSLQDRLLEGLPEGFRAVSEMAEIHRSNILCVAADSEEATTRAYRLLRDEQVVVSFRESRLRFSPNVYNSAEEIDRVLELLARA